jgi:hypothetical protein
LIDKYFDTRSRLYKKHWLYFLAVGVFAIVGALAIQSFFPDSNNWAWFGFFIGLGYGLIVCAEVTRRFEKRLPNV